MRRVELDGLVMTVIVTNVQYRDNNYMDIISGYKYVVKGQVSSTIARITVYNLEPLPEHALDWLCTSCTHTGPSVRAVHTTLLSVTTHILDYQLALLSVAPAIDNTLCL